MRRRKGPEKEKEQELSPKEKRKQTVEWQEKLEEKRDRRYEMAAECLEEIENAEAELGEVLPQYTEMKAQVAGLRKKIDESKHKLTRILDPTYDPDTDKTEKERQREATDEEDE